jgi:FkbM family methyltransferase
MKYFLDGGANIGQTFEQFLLPRGYGDHHILCVEPSVRHYPELLAQLRRYRPAFHAVTVCPFALARSFGLARLYEKTDPYADSLYDDLAVNEPMLFQVLTATIPLSALIQQHLQATDSLEIKLDVEGAEDQILEEFLAAVADPSQPWPTVTRIWVEWHRARTPTERIAAHAQRLGIELCLWPF